IELPRRKLRPDRTAADSRAINFHVRKCLDGKTTHGTRRTQCSHISTTRMAEAEIRTNTDLARAATRNDHAIDEILRRHCGQRFIEMQQQQPLDTAIRDQPNLVAHTGKTRERPTVRKIRAWNRLETDCNRNQPERIGAFTHARQQRTMAQMNAIERPDTQHASAGRQRRARKIPINEVHRREYNGWADAFAV
ncbi:MAG: hypothetical protein WBQ57_13990, partial [Rhodanobacteraceae bacterium]